MHGDLQKPYKYATLTSSFTNGGEALGGLRVLRDVI